jgi:uncharacterized protein
MPFEHPGPAPRRIAIIGGGISGMAAAYMLARNHAVVLYEAEGRLGGHARTVMAGKRGDQPVDTGFIVFNHVNYPNVLRMFTDLDVPTVHSNMSFGASFGGGRLEYGLASLDAVFAQRRNIVNPSYLRMLRDIFRFNARAMDMAEPGMTIGGLLDRLGTGPMFRDCYILPLSGAIWSTPSQGILDFPAAAMLRFFKNHALMSVSGQHQWWTVKGGSIEYVRRLQAWLVQHGVDLRLGAPIAGVRRAPGGAQVRAEGAEWEGFDEVILATHSDDALRLLSDPHPDEVAALSPLRYQANEAVLHSDTSIMPKHRSVWSSWNYVEPAGPRPDRIDLTYWMNSLQPIPKDDPLFVTLNTNRPIRQDLIHDTVTFRHPVYDLAAEQGRADVRAMNGARSTWFCGAWMRDGFHEDGFASAVEVVEAMQARSRMAA